MLSSPQDNSVYDEPEAPTRRGHQPVRVALAVVGALVAGVYLAALRNPEPVVVIEEIEDVSTADVPRPRALGAAAPVATQTPAGSGETEEPVCEGMHPGPSWRCEDGKWQLGPELPAPASGGGRIDRAGGCLTEQPGPLFECQGGLWMIRGSATASSTTATTPDSRSECPAPAPGSDWRCEDGAWEPPPSGPPTPVPPTAPEPAPGDPVQPAPPVPPAPEPIEPVPPSAPPAPSSGDGQ